MADFSFPTLTTAVVGVTTTSTSRANDVSRSVGTDPAPISAQLTILQLEA